MKFIYISLFIFFITSCATTGNNATTYEQTEVGTPNQEKSVLVLYRKMVPPLAYSVESTINGVAFASLPNESFSWTYLPHGKHEIKISWPFLALTPSKTINLEVEVGKYYFVELGGSTTVANYGGMVAFNTQDISLESYQVGIKSVKNCCKYVPAKF